MPTMSKTIAVDRPDGDYLEITVEERLGDHTLSDGFSITGLRWDRRDGTCGRTRKKQGHDADVAGCIHEEILAALPQLAPIVAVHLADPTGLPMHAKANGWYFYSGKAAAYERRKVAEGEDHGYSRMLERSDHDRAADALHIAPERLPKDLRTREEFDAFVDGLGQTYHEQARLAREVIAGLNGDPGFQPAARLSSH